MADGKGLWCLEANTTHDVLPWRSGSLMLLDLYFTRSCWLGLSSILSLLKYRERYLWGLRTLLSKVSPTVAMTTEIVWFGFIYQRFNLSKHTHTHNHPEPPDSALHSGFPTPSPHLSEFLLFILDELSVQTMEPGKLYMGLSCS